MTHEQAQELLADFALGLLDGGEQAAVHAHVQDCGECRADLQVFLHAGEALAIAPVVAELPAGAAERIAAGVRAKLDPRRPQGLPSNVIVGPWRNIALGAAAGVFLLAVGLTAVTIAWLDARDEADRLATELEGDRAAVAKAPEYALPHLALAEAYYWLSGIYAPPPDVIPKAKEAAARAIELPLSGEGVSGTIYVASNFAGGVARFTGLAEAPAQHHYQLWSEGPYGAKSAADFTGSNGELLVQLPELPKEMTRMFVTLEPDGATGAAPTGPEVLSTPR